MKYPKDFKMEGLNALLKVILLQSCDGKSNQTILLILNIGTPKHPSKVKSYAKVIIRISKIEEKKDTINEFNN